MKRLRTFPLLVAFFLQQLCIPAHGGNGGIHFERRGWHEILQMAKSQHKLVFADFYTQWCGPCLNMVENVFSLPEVGAFYNDHFICVQIDAEHGEGVALASKYHVRLYPTYCFIDPDSEQAVHVSSSTQTPETFIETGKGALVPEKHSTYLTEAYQKGKRDKDFLLNYIHYKHAVHDREAVGRAFNQLIETGHTLRDSMVWKAFVVAISGLTPYLQDVSRNYEDYCRLYSKKSVDAKLFAETKYGKPSEIERLCDFEGKQFNLAFIRIENDMNRMKFDEAAAHIDSLLADTVQNKTEIMNRLKFLVGRARHALKESPHAWNMKCLEYARYLAYNWPDRKDGSIHQLYADMLEQLMKQEAQKDEIAKLISQPPRYGTPSYSMRSSKLKRKPGVL